jgi:hypothetical protein
MFSDWVSFLVYPNLFGIKGFVFVVVVCCSYELLFYPRYHLDQSSLLCRKTLLAKPIVMDAFHDYILVTYNPFDVHIFNVKISGELTPAGSPHIQVR